MNEHRGKLASFDHVLNEISENPTVIEDHEFEAKLRALNEKVNIVLEDAKSGAGGGSGKSLTQKVEDLNGQLADVDISIGKVDRTHDDSRSNLEEANRNLDEAQNTILQASRELSVSSLNLSLIESLKKSFCFRLHCNSFRLKEFWSFQEQRTNQINSINNPNK